MKSLLNLVGISHTLHAKSIVPLLSDGTPLLLVPEPTNKYDPNAIQVWVRIGYIKREQALNLAPLLRGENYPAMIANSHTAYAEIEIEEPNSGPEGMGGPL